MFEPHNDTISSMEAPPVMGHFIDTNGADWASRSDTMIDSIMSKVELTHDEYWHYKKYLNARQWFELDMFLDRLLKNANEDDVTRINKAKENVAKAQGENLNG